MLIQADSRAKRKQSPVRSLVASHTVDISGHRTGVSLEAAFWCAMQEIAIAQGTTRTGLITAIDKRCRNTNLSSAIRLFVLTYYQEVADTKKAVPQRRPMVRAKVAIQATG